MKKLCLALLCLACSAPASATTFSSVVKDSRFDVVVSVDVDTANDTNKWTGGGAKFNVLVCNRSPAPVIGQGVASSGNFGVAKDICIPLTGITSLQLMHGTVPWKAKVYIRWQ